MRTPPSSSPSSSVSSSFQTPPPRTPSCRRKQGNGSSNKSPVIPEGFTPKTVYLIRHGQSLGQAAPAQARRKDPSLIDCGLSRLGRSQAESLGQLIDTSQIDLVVSSPLTRALETAALGFPQHNIVVHYDLREVGTKGIPENIPRPIKQVKRDLGELAARVDFSLNQPDEWPRRHDTPPKTIRRNHIRQVFEEWLVQRPEQTIAVVCHYHVIRAALSDPYRAQGSPIQPMNGEPICAQLSVVDGRVRLQQVEEPSKEEPEPMEL